MCQLTLIHTNTTYNRNILIPQLILNAEDGNKDGVGFYSKETLWKDGISANTIINLGSIVKKHVINNPVMGHVRLASANNGVKTISRDYSHPFDGATTVLEHNGSLKLKDPKDLTDEETKGLIDSQIFQLYLEKIRDTSENKDIEYILPLVMNKFYGKFAFIIYDKLTKDFYVVRGKTADLQKTDITIKVKDKINKGVVVNTSEKTLFINLLQIQNLLQLYGVEFEFGDINALKPETIFLLKDDNLTEVGTIKENSYPVQSAAIIKSGRNYNQTTYYSNFNSKNSLEEQEYKLVYDFLSENNLNVHEFDQIVFGLLGKSLLDIDDEDLDVIIYHIIPVIRERNNKVKIQLWDGIKKIHKTREFYEELQFPYMMNSGKQIKEIYGRLKNDLNESKNISVSKTS